ncbi:MAG: FAD-binding protein [Alphaproteobacteria bacterium]|nr:FAD-binding protein [Alphaproteobacteria bacterium]
MQHFDLIAIGGGFAGLVAGLRAAELGLRAAVVEQGAQDRYLCSSRWAGGIFHVSYHDVKLGKAELLDAVTRATGGEAEPALAEAVAEDAGRAVDWLAAHEAAFARASDIPWHRWTLAPPRAAVAGPDWQGRGPDVTLDRLRSRLEGFQGRLLLDTRAVSLRMAGGRCIGVTTCRAGERCDIAGGAVVIADGGFPANADLFREHIGPRPDRVLIRNAGTARGDGMRMARDIGAATTRLDRFYGHLLSRDAMNQESLSPYPQIDAVATAAIVVDAAGTRLVDESLGGIAITNHLARLEDPLCATVICDAAIWDRAGRTAQIPPNPELERGGGTLHCADTIERLADAAGISSTGLAATVSAYNRAVHGNTLDKLSPPRSVRSGLPAPITTPPFFAIPICAAITNTMGGIAIDGHGRVRRPDGSTIDSLYAAGGASGGLEGGGPAIGYVGGLIKACVFGLRAAEHAARK